MNLSIYIIVRALREAFGSEGVCAFLHTDPLETRLSFPQVYDRALPLRDDVLYIVDAESFPKACRRVKASAGRSAAFVVVDPCLAVDMGERIDVVYLGLAAGLSEAVNEVIAIFGRFSAWQQDLERELDAGALARDVLRISMPIVRNDIWLIDSNNQLICKQGYPEGDIAWEDGFLGEERERFAPGLIADAQGLPLKVGTDVIAVRGYFGEKNRVPCVSARFGLPNNYGAGVCILEHTRPVDDADLSLVKLITPYLQRAYTDVRKKETPIKTHGQRPFFKRVVQGKNVNAHGAARALEQLGWDLENGEYECFCLDYVYEVSHATGFEVKPFAYISARLHELFTCVVFQFDHCLVAVVNIAIVKNSFSYLRKELNQMLDENRCLCGLSDPFYDILELEGAYKQAKAALEIGGKQSAGNLFRFRDFVEKYAIESVIRDMQPAHVVDPRVFDLLAFDEEHDLNLYGTLEEHIRNNFKVADTCRAMYLQRNSLVYRLGRIEQITGFDLDDPDTRFLLQLYLKILGEYGV